MAGTKGIQAVELARWSNASVKNFTGVINSAQAPNKIEFAFVPTFNRANPYGNAKTVIDGLLKAGKQVTVAVHLGFHLGDNSPGEKANPSKVASQLSTLTDSSVANETKASGNRPKTSGFCVPDRLSRSRWLVWSQ